ncbi:hypothetical protein [Parasegetibacter sp. NRK P23]|uniref:pirin family protein n=1 Tax=Parasegetibacter sp. NRK P23 TaxID=2942999 RepID=UPI0020439AE6|nr:hypothetical protein [Parasegetibacter sp. NRK P23]MCM5529065.1 hypothetical protein [Parasegetibacter sp. NRK P23]
MFLSEQRGCNELSWFRSYNTFNFGGYFNPYKIPFGNLYVLNDDTLAGGKSLLMQVEEPSVILLIPVVGAVQYKDDYGNDAFVEAGACMVARIGGGKKLELINPYANELINFIQIWFRVSTTESFGNIQTFLFNLDAHPNVMLPLFSADESSVAKPFIGKFDGRVEGEMCVSEGMNGFFVFVIEGAFEVEGRLLHARDGLALWNLQKIEWEALSGGAILMVLQIPRG